MKYIGYKRLKELNERNKTIIKVREIPKENYSIYNIEKKQGSYFLVSDSVTFPIIDIDTLYTVLEYSLFHYRNYITNLNVLCTKNSFLLTHLYLTIDYWKVIYKSLYDCQKNITDNDLLQDLKIVRTENLDTYKSKIVLTGGIILLDMPYRFCIVLKRNVVYLISEYIFVVDSKTRMFMNNLQYNVVYIDNIFIDSLKELYSIVDTCKYNKKIIKRIG